VIVRVPVLETTVTVQLLTVVGLSIAIAATPTAIILHNVHKVVVAEVAAVRLDRLSKQET
jgi:hypothetical protein